MKIFLSGPITHDPDYRSKFKAAEERITAKGHLVWNPAVHSDGFKHKEYMAVCIPAVEFCDGIYMLQGWENSVGATQEFAHAVKNNKQIFMEADL